MNLPNKLSIARIVMIPVLVALMYPQNEVCRWLSVAVFALASFTDFLDGYIARRDHIVTDFGKFVDPVADKLLVLCAIIMLCYRQLMLSWVLCLILGRELCVDGLRMIAVGKGKVIAAGWLGKIKTVSQILLVLWLMITQRPMIMDPITDNLFGLLLTGWVVVITLWSGIDYFVKNGRFLME